MKTCPHPSITTPSRTGPPLSACCAAGRPPRPRRSGQPALAPSCNSSIRAAGSIRPAGTNHGRSIRLSRGGQLRLWQLPARSNRSNGNRHSAAIVELMCLLQPVQRGMPCLMPHVPPSFSSRRRFPPRSSATTEQAPRGLVLQKKEAGAVLQSAHTVKGNFQAGQGGGVFLQLCLSLFILAPGTIKSLSNAVDSAYDVVPSILLASVQSSNCVYQHEFQDSERKPRQRSLFFRSSQMEPIRLNRQRTYAAIPETSPTPPTRRFKDFDNIEYGDIYRKWSICVRVEVKFRPNKYGDNISFILMDKNGAKIEANVCGHAKVERFNRILQPGCKYVIHRVKISSNMEEVEFRAIRHTYECYFNQQTIVEPSVPIESPALPKHLMPFLDVYKRPNKTFVDIVGIVVHCCERERVGMCNNYREAIFMDAWGNLIAVGIWGSQLIQNSYMWSTAEGGNPIVIATMLQKDIEFGDVNTLEHTKFAFNRIHHAMRPLQDIRHKIISGAIDMSFVRRFLERRWAFCAIVLAKRDARYKKLM